ncbi:MAG: hypothetical protein IBX72_07115 [Nitrospirae bacterium]|nr:hypothetical protein [Nitrospirota bacterium]
MIDKVQIARPYVIHKLGTIPPIEKEQEFYNLLERDGLHLKDTRDWKIKIACDRWDLMKNFFKENLGLATTRKK